MEMPKLGEAHEAFQRMAGIWKGRETLFPSPWDPKGGPAEGEVTNTVALGGFILQHHYVQRREGKITFEGHGVYSWDTASSSYHLMWWDSMGSPPNLFVGNFDGDVLTLTSESPMGKNRAIWDYSNGKCTFRMEVSPDGQQWFTFMSGEYARS